jgi:hypothetical protein
LKEVVYRLLEYSWFREIVSQNTYTANSHFSIDSVREIGYRFNSQ